MYKIMSASKRIEKKLREYMTWRSDIANKLDRLKLNPRKEVGAHPLHGRLVRKWACWLGSNIRLVYSIDDDNKLIILQAIGTHNIY